MKNKINVILALFIMLVVFLMYSFPLLHDDMLHATVGLGFNFMPHVNGRYLGNFFSIILASDIFLRVIIKSLIIFLIIFISKKLLKIKDNIYVLMFIILFLFMPKEMFRETIPFTAGFSNYVMPIVGILYIIYIHLNDIFKKFNNFFIPIFFLLGIINSLFVEHLTLFNLILSIYLIIYYYIKTKKINYICLSYFLGSLAGTILMFTNPTYLATANGNDTYRAFSTFQEILKKPWAILRAAFFHNYAMNFSLIFLGLSLYKNIKEKSYITKIIVVFILLFGFYSLMKLLNFDMTILANYTKHFESLITFIFFMMFGYLVYISKILKKFEIYRLLFFVMSIVLILVPLVMVSPLGPRCYIGTYILMIIFIIDLFMILERNKIININNLSSTLLILVLIQMVFYLNIYGKIYLKNIERLKIINQQISQGSEIIDIEKLPYSNHLHMPTFCSEYSEVVFREFYKLSNNIKIKSNCE